MAADPLDQVLRLVAEGRLSAEEAAPILAALDEQGTGRPAAEPWAGRSGPPGGFGFDTPPDPTGWPGPTTQPGPGRSSSTLRIEVRDAGRNVVNLRLPLAVGRFALDRVPGLSNDQVDRVREAMSSGFRGPILDVDDDGDGVRISIE
jgi:SHOCT-like protein